LGVKSLLALNQKESFDCPGCAWPDPDGKRSAMEFCENGAKAVAEEATKKRIGREFFKKWSVHELSEQSDFWIGKQGRLTEPMILEKGASHYEPLSFDQAFKKISDQLNKLEHPDDAIFYTSGRTSNEAAFLYQLFVRMLGTNNLPDCSNMCHESSGVGLSETIGIVKGSVTLDDFEKSDCIIVIGQNPGTNHPRMLSSLQSAKKNGANIITINPLREAGLQAFLHPQKPWQWLSFKNRLTDTFLQVKINGDIALLKGIMKHMLVLDLKSKNKLLNHQFIEEYTKDFDAFSNDLEECAWADIEEQSGIAKSQIENAAAQIIQAKSLIVCWAMGLTQHKNAVSNIQMIVNLLLLGGHFGRPGAGACPVRGHSNVQGDRTMGICERPGEDFLNRLEEVFNFKVPRKHGYDVVSAIKAMHEQKGKIFFALGGNFLSAAPDTEYTARALNNCKLTVQVSTKLNRSHLITGDEAIILPCLGRTEIDIKKTGSQFVSVENSMGVVHSSKGILRPASSSLKSEVAIVCQLAHKTLESRSSLAGLLDWQSLEQDYNLIRDLIEKVIPGFKDYNIKVRKPQGFYLPNPVRDHLQFKTTNKKAKFSVHPLPNWRLKKYQYLMMTIRTHDQYNTTIYGLNDRYRGIKGGRRVVLMNPKDIEEAQLKKGDFVDITSHFQQEERSAKKFMVVPYDIPRQCVASYFPETNVLVPIQSSAIKSHTPTSKSIVVSFKKHQN